MLSERYEAVRRRLAQACARSARPTGSVTLIGVTKTLPPAQIREAIALGMQDLGESRVQEMRDKRRELEKDATAVRWHLIGHLQRNKVKQAVELFDVLHCVDSEPLAQDLNEACAARKETGALSTTQSAASVDQLPVFVQVNVSGEASKFGCASAAAKQLAQRIVESPHLKLAGLMTIAPYSVDPENARPCFRALADLRRQVAGALGGWPLQDLKLSMGMSDDFEVAIEEGADFVRIGSALFGPRE